MVDGGRAGYIRDGMWAGQNILLYITLGPFREIWE